MTPNLITVNLNAAPVATDSQVTKDVSTQAQQDVQSITPAATETPADAAAVPDNTDTETGQTLATDTTHDGNMAVPGKVGGNGTKPRGALRARSGPRRDQISSSISKVTGGLKGGTKSDNTGAIVAGTGLQSDNTGDTSGRHRVQSDNTGDTDSTDNTGGSGGTGGRHRADVRRDIASGVQQSDAVIVGAGFGGIGAAIPSRGGSPVHS